MFACLKRELKSYFTTLNAVLYIVVFLVVTGIYTLAVNFYSQYSELEYALSSMVIMLMLLIPILTMRFFTEERQQNITPLTYSMPVPMYKQVMAKFVSCVIIYSIPLVILCTYPLILSLYGDVTFATAYWGIFGYWLMGVCMITIGMFVSSMTKSPSIAAVVSFLVFLLFYLAEGMANLVPSAPVASFLILICLALLAGGLLYYLTRAKWVSLIVTLSLLTVISILYAIFSLQFSGLIADAVAWFSIYNRYYSFYNGIVDLTAVVYYLSLAFAGLCLCVISVEKKRWS